MAVVYRGGKKRPEEKDGVPLRADREDPSLELRRENADLRQEIARLRIENRMLLRAANTDELTQIFNRAGLNEAFAGTLEKNSTGAIILIDLDQFKEINDTRGHAVGDSVLVKAAQTLKDNVRNNDIVARYGGDEFIIVLENITDEEAQNKLEELREKFKNIWAEYDDIQIQFKASFGMATYKAGDDIDAVKAQADARMYASKNAKGNAPRGAGITPP